jgi:hypothetical protein
MAAAASTAAKTEESMDEAALWAARMP